MKLSKKDGLPIISFNVSKQVSVHITTPFFYELHADDANGGF
jgi:hypothetical protein